MLRYEISDKGLSPGLQVAFIQECPRDKRHLITPSRTPFRTPFKAEILRELPDAWANQFCPRGPPRYDKRFI